MKTTVLESSFNKMQAFKLATLSKRDSSTGFFMRVLLDFKSNYFETHLWTAASENFSFNPNKAGLFEGGLTPPPSFFKKNYLISI